MFAVNAFRSAGRELRQLLRAETPTHSLLRDRLTVVVVVSVGLDLLCAVLALLFERHVQNTDIQSYGSALFWTSTQLLTVSSQIQNPLSVGGRILDVFMEAYAITVVATMAGSLGAFMVRRGHEREMAAARGPGADPGPRAQASA